MKIQQSTKRIVELLASNGSYYVVKIKYSYLPGDWSIEKFGSGSSPMETEKNALKALDDEINQEVYEVKENER